MSVRDRIDELVTGNEVVLFMKGTRMAPQCGFSATVVDILDDFLEDYTTVDVLADPHIRAGIKEYSEWPTIPQLYVKGKFVGGSDIIREMQGNGELEETLGKGPLGFTTPEITILNPAIKALEKHWDGDGKPAIRLEIDRQYRTALYFDEPRDDDVVMDDERFSVFMDRSTARRASGVSIDWVDGARGAGFKIDNPNEPPRVKQVQAQALKKWMDEGKAIELFDCRTPEERSKARIEGTVLLDGKGKERLDALDKDTVLVLHCHHGRRSQAAAEHCIRMGFKEVYNLEGGIDAWSLDVDETVPRY